MKKMMIAAAAALALTTPAFAGEDCFGVCGGVKIKSVVEGLLAGVAEAKGDHKETLAGGNLNMYQSLHVDEEGIDFNAGHDMSSYLAALASGTKNAAVTLVGLGEVKHIVKIDD